MSTIEKNHEQILEVVANGSSLFVWQSYASLCNHRFKVCLRTIINNTNFIETWNAKSVSLMARFNHLASHCKRNDLSGYTTFLSPEDTTWRWKSLAFCCHNLVEIGSVCEVGMSLTFRAALEHQKDYWSSASWFERRFSQSFSYKHAQKTEVLLFLLNIPSILSRHKLK